MATKFNPKVGDLVYIRWEDHCSYHGSQWERVAGISEQLNTASICETVGFVVHITPQAITTVASITVNRHEDGEDGSHIATRLRKAIVQGKIIKRF